jgi:hypothetical protein
VWFFSLRGLSVLALIVLPLLLLLSQIGFEELRSFFITRLQNGTFSLEYVNSQIYIYYIIIYFQYSVFIVTLIVYPLFSVVYSSERYFQKRGYENTVIGGALGYRDRRSNFCSSRNYRCSDINYCIWFTFAWWTIRWEY